MHVADKDLIAKLSPTLDGPPLTHAVYARTTTAVGPARMLGPLGNYLIARPAARSAARDAEERTEVPQDAAMVLGLTDTALHVWSADPMLSQVRDHLGEVARTEIRGAGLQPGATWQELTLHLANGEALDVQARGDVGGLVAALGAV